ncbi:MAG: DUF4340 domain-containing protein [Anaerolineales bacterium]
MNRRATVVYTVLFLALIGVYLYLNNRVETAEVESTVEPAPEVTYLFTAEEGPPSSIRIESKDGQTVEIARDEETAWMVIQPVEAAADPGAAEAAATQATTMRIVDSIADIDPKIIGLDIPEYVLTIKFTGGVERTVDVGVLTPTESGYYVRAEDDEIVIVSRSAVDALLSLLDNPPYLTTPTPLPVTEPPEAGAPTETATPQPQG